MATIKLKTKPVIGGEEEIVDRVSRSRGPIENSVEVRDLISGLVGGGYTNLANEDAQKNFVRLQSILGRPKANELVQKIMIHNQDPRYKAKPIEERVTTFYDQQKGDPVVGDARSLGYGVLPSFRTSPNVLLQTLQGKSPTSGAGVDPTLVKKIALKIKN